MTPEAPLTKADAPLRCLAEVPNAYPEAFKRAWAKLEPSRKRARGKHGPRPWWAIASMGQAGQGIAHQ
jgi:hypothetical protein